MTVPAREKRGVTAVVIAHDVRLRLGLAAALAALACACEITPTPTPSGIPATGQQRSFGENARESEGGAPPTSANGSRTSDAPRAIPDDGALRAGAPMRFHDNGDGTLTDQVTGLVWEKKSDDGGLHDKDTVFTWKVDGALETIWAWIAAVNAEGGVGFGGHRDWRVANVKELVTILDYSVPAPRATVPPAFTADCAPGCGVIACSCTGASYYWSSTSDALNEGSAWVVGFANGAVGLAAKKGAMYVRAVRGGTLSGGAVAGAPAGDVAGAERPGSPVRPATSE
jgi:hypothetical protein